MTVVQSCYRTWVAIALACLAMQSVMAAPATPPTIQVWQRLEQRAAGDVLVVAHRSCWNAAPENSLAALNSCIQIGVDAVELDVRHTRDGVAVVLHDETVDRTTDGTGQITELKWAQVRKLHLRQRDGGATAALTDERIPTLVEFLAAAKNKVALVMDVKDWSQASTFAAIKAARMQRQAIFFYECNNNRLLEKISAFREQVMVFPIMFENDGPLLPAMDRCRSHPAKLAHVKYQHREWLDAAAPALHRNGQRLWFATMFDEDVAGAGDAAALRDPSAVWGNQIDAGAIMIMTNEPQALLTYLRQRQAR